MQWFKKKQTRWQIFISKYSRGEMNYSLFQTLPSQQLSVQSWRPSGVFIVNFDRVFIVNFEQLNTGWVPRGVFRKQPTSKVKVFAGIGNGSQSMEYYGWLGFEYTSVIY